MNPVCRSVIRALCASALVSCARGSDESANAQSTATPAPAAAVVSPAAFNGLRWLEGRWVGTGERQSAFYEQYAFVDDSTLVSRSFADSTFRQVSDSSVIQLRSTTLESVSSTTRYVAIAIGPDSVVFAPGAGARNGFRWRSRSPTEWIAVIESSGRAPVIYQMRKLQ